MKDGWTESPVKPQGHRLMISKTQGVCLIKVRDTQSSLSHNERTSDEHGNACVQHSLTSW
jgi:hypothetical protein